MCIQSRRFVVAPWEFQLPETEKDVEDGATWENEKEQEQEPEPEAIPDLR